MRMHMHMQAHTRTQVMVMLNNHGKPYGQMDIVFLVSG